MARSWLYQACTPGLPKVGAAEPEFCSCAEFAISFHLPVTLAALPLEPVARKMPCSTESAFAAWAAGDCTIAYRWLPSAEYAKVVRPMSLALICPVGWTRL